MSKHQTGDFFWYELLTSDSAAAQTFYEKIIGWSIQDSGKTEMKYLIASTSTGAVGGIMSITEEMKQRGCKPCWMGYIYVDDVDKAAQKIKDDGGKVCMEPWDIKDVGRIAFVADPQGGMFYIMTPSPPSSPSDDGVSKAFALKEPIEGHCAWNELATTDQSSGIKFYCQQFNWKESENSMDMGPMGQYKMFLDSSDNMIGGVMKKPDVMPCTFWSYYFRVKDIDQAVKDIEANGGKITLPPTAIPNGDFQLNAMDPQGAPFCLIGKKTTE